MIHDVEWLQAIHQWPGLTRSSWSKAGGDQRQDHRRDTLLHDLAGDASHRGRPMIRAHWAIENSLHWVMDMVCREMNAASEPTTPQLIRNLPAYRRQSHPQRSGKDPIRLRRKTAGWDDEYLASLIAA